MAKKIPIDELRRVLSYDPATGVITNIVRRGNSAAAGAPAGYLMPIGYIGIMHKQQMYYAHRIAWSFTHGAIPEGMNIDHINGNPADNRISNLRLATQSDNAANSRGHRDAKLPKGVKFTTLSKVNPYSARIMVRGETIYLGRFKTLDAASDAYGRAAQKLRGRFARTT